MNHFIREKNKNPFLTKSLIIGPTEHHIYELKPRPVYMFPFLKICFLWVHLKMHTQIYVFTMTQYRSYNFKEDHDSFLFQPY